MSKGRRSCLSVLYAVSQGWPAENLNRIKNLGTDEGGAKQAYRHNLPLECCPTLAFQHKMLPSYLRAATHILPSEPTFVFAVLLLTIPIFKLFLPPNNIRRICFHHISVPVAFFSNCFVPFLVGLSS